MEPWMIRRRASYRRNTLKGPELGVRSHPQNSTHWSSLPCFAPLLWIQPLDSRLFCTNFFTALVPNSNSQGRLGEPHLPALLTQTHSSRLYHFVGTWFSLQTLWAQTAHTSASRYETELCSSAQTLGEHPGNKLDNYFSLESTLCSQYQESILRKLKLLNFAPLDTLLLQSFTHRELTVPRFVEPQADCFKL